MPRLIFEGHSDDTFGEYGHTMQDYDCCASGALIVFSVIVDDNGIKGLRVVGQYGSTDWPDSLPACWLIGVMQLDEDIAIPNWPMKFETAKSGYSPKLFIEAPDGVKVKCVNSSDEFETI